MAGVESDVLLGGRFRLIRPMASGGMGTVWEAEDAVLHRRVAVKVLSDALAADHQFVERFRREARAAAGLSHPHVAGIFDYGQDAERGTQFIVMELIEGETLSARLRRMGRMPPEEAALIAAAVSDALQAAHDAGVIHRDIKPANIMVTLNGDVKVMDFGIAAAAWAAPITATGTAMGTATYISPELAAGERATAASDIYSLGVVLYEMVAGHPPFTGHTPVAVATAHVRDDPPPLAGAAPNVPAYVASACHKALEKDPAARPPSAAAFAAMLRRSQDPTVASPGARGGAAERAGAAPVSAGEAFAGEGEQTSVLGPATGTQVLPTASTPTPVASPPAPPGFRRSRRPIRGWLWLVAGLLALLLIALVISSITGDNFTPTPPRPTPPGPSPSVAVPSVAGMKVDQAKATLAASGLTAGPVRAVRDTPPGIVARTDPPAGTSVPPGTVVTLFAGAAEHDHGKGKGKGHDD